MKSRPMVKTTGISAALLSAAWILACSGNGSSSGDGDGDNPSSGGVSGSSGGMTSGDGDGDLPGSGGSSTGGGGPGSGGNGTGGSGNGSVIPGTSDYDCSPAEGTPGGLALTPVASDLTRPLLVVHPPDDDRLFVVEQAGVIRLLDGDTNPVFLDISDKVLDPSDGLEGYHAEQGLLGVAFHPEFATNNLIYVHYSARVGQTDFGDGDTVIAEYTANGDTVDSGSERVVLHVNQPDDQNNHNGGTIAFGSDAMLYIALGDGGGGNDTYGNGQNETTLLGAILRINPLESGDDDYTIPTGNLQDVLDTAAPELWDYGLRNPFRMNFDACTGDLYIGDVGQDTREEINIEKAGEGHQNYGWNIVEGTICRPGGDSGCDLGAFTAPVHDYPRSEAGGAVIAGAVYRGSEIPWLRGTFFFADEVQGRIWSTVYNRQAGTVSTPTELTSSLDINTPAAIQNGPDGEVYFVSLFGGTVYKLTAQ